MDLTPDSGTMFSLVDLPACNPWWDSEKAVPAAGRQRADFEYRVNNTVANRLLIIPGPPGTGKTRTLRGIIRELVSGDDNEVEPEQVCYVPCDDPLARLVDGFVGTAIERGPIERSDGEFFVFLDGIHRLPDWRTQLNSAINGLAMYYPEDDWHIVATVPTSAYFKKEQFGTELANRDDHVKIDLPHHVQNFRDSFLHSDALADASERVLEEKKYPGEQNAVRYARTRFEQCATGDSDGSDLVDVLRDIKTAVLDSVDLDTIEEQVDHYLLTGGFDTALENPIETASSGDLGAHTDPNSPVVQRIHAHILSSLEATVYREIPQVVKVEEDLTRIEEPRDLNAVAAYIARQGYEETSYKTIASELSRDSRTVKQKYIGMLADFHVIAKSTRYDLERERSVRFFFRSPGYVSSLLRSNPLETHREDLLLTTLADHLHRQRNGFGAGTNGVEYWRNDEVMVDFVLEASEGAGAIPFVTAFTSGEDNLPGTFSQFRETIGDADEDKDLDVSDLEVVVGGPESGIELSPGSNEVGHRITIPYWLLLLIC